MFKRCRRVYRECPGGSCHDEWVEVYLGRVLSFDAIACLTEEGFALGRNIPNGIHVSEGLTDVCRGGCERVD